MDYVVKDVNHAFTVITGLSADKVCGRRIAGLFSISSTTTDIEIFAKVAITGDPIEKEFLSPIFGMHFKLLCFSPEKGVFVALLSDLTKQKKYQEKIDFLENFTNSTSDEIYILDSSGRFVMGNRETAERLGVSRKQLPGIHISRLNPLADEDWWSTLWSSLLKKGSLQFESEHRDSSGDLYPVEISVDLMKTDKTGLAAMVAKNVSSKRALSSALMKDQRLAGKAASAAGYLIWMLDSSGFFRPLIGGNDIFIPGPAEDVFFGKIHREDRSVFATAVKSETEGTLEFRLRTDKGFVYHRAVWARVEKDCTSGICYPLSGAGLAGLGSESAVMDTYCKMTESVYRKLVKTREALEADKPEVASRTIRTLTSEFSFLTGQSAFPEKVRFDSFLEVNAGMFKQLLQPVVSVEIDSTENSFGLIDPTFLENIVVRLLLVVRDTELVNKVSLKTESGARDSGLLITLHGREGIQNELERSFIPLNGPVPGLASVYAMVRSSGGRVRYSSRDNKVLFNLRFPRAGMSDESATILIALPGSVDSARLYAALRNVGYSVAIESNADEIRRRFAGSGSGILIVSDSMAEFSVEEMVSSLPGVKIIQIGGRSVPDGCVHFPEGFRASDLVLRVKEFSARAEMLPEEDLQGGILWGEPHLTPPLS